MSRYVVTELEGDMTPRTGNGRAPAGVSCHVIDTQWNHRLVQTYRTENLSNYYANAARRGKVRDQANEHAERLNAAHLREAVSPHSETAA